MDEPTEEDVVRRALTEFIDRLIRIVLTDSGAKRPRPPSPPREPELMPAPARPD